MHASRRNFTKPYNQHHDKYVNELIISFNDYLENVRGLSSSTRKLYCNHAQYFMISTLKEHTCIDSICPYDVIKFIVFLVRNEKSKTAKRITYSLRSFFRFLAQSGILKNELSNCVPSVASWKHTTFPITLTIEEVHKLLNNCSKTSMIGLRDHAILMLLTRLGLRACEICHLNLEDLDWERSEIIIRGKGNAQNRFPILKDVGESLVNYLRHGRPSCSVKSFFVCMTTPVRGIQSSSTIRSILRRALNRAGLSPEKKGTHLLRHSFATQLLKEGASLQEIATVLQHKSISTTALYARVDFDKLKILALPWPGSCNVGG